MRNRSRLQLLLLSLLVAAMALAPAAFGLARSQPAPVSLVSKGIGRQQLAVGGLTFGTLQRSGQLTVRDLSVSGDLHITISPARVGRVSAGGYVYAASGRRGMVFKVSGSRYQLTLRGNSTLNGVGIRGMARLRGVGTYSLDGAPYQPWAGKLRLAAPASPPGG